MRRRVDEECDDDDENENDNDGMDGAGDAMDDLDYDFLSYELEYLSVYGYRRSIETTHARESLMRGNVQLFRRRSAADIGIVLSGGTNRDDDDVVAVPSSGC